MSELLLDAAGRRRSPATRPGFHAGRAPRNKRIRYPADPPTVEEIVAVMRGAGDGVHGRRLRGLLPPERGTLVRMTQWLSGPPLPREAGPAARRFLPLIFVAASGRASQGRPATFRKGQKHSDDAPLLAELRD
jgi:hypothetical protein